MNQKVRAKAALVLEDRAGVTGPVFYGELFGAPISIDSYKLDRGYGEVVFNTSMTGYQEILTDPSYYGQMVCMTYPHIGNYGVNKEDEESDHPWCGGFIIHDLSFEPSNFRATEDLESYLTRHGIPGILGIDTRALTRFLRTSGVIRGIIVKESEVASAQNLLRELPKFEGRDLIKEVTTKKSYVFAEKPKQKKFKIVAVDFGAKRNLFRSLVERGCEIEVLPATATAAEVMAHNPDGIFLSNGPGDPQAAAYAVSMVKEVLGKKPLFGVCMGHQILSLAVGAKAYKLKFGHRGGNQPVLDLTTNKVEISSHNHGYSMREDSYPSEVKVSQINLNDKTIEGIEIPTKKAFSVQYHPEAAPGPHDSAFLFDRFIAMMEN